MISSCAQSFIKLVAAELPSISFDLKLDDLISDNGNLIDTLLGQLTAGLTSISTSDISFSGGPLGEIVGIFDNIGLDFDNMMEEFVRRYDTFKADLSTLTPEKQTLFNLRPVSLPRFPSILQLGSRLPSAQFSPEISNLLWDKLSATFPSPTFNGVKLPHIPSGLTFAATFSRGEFPGKMTKSTHDIN